MIKPDGTINIKTTPQNPPVILNKLDKLSLAKIETIKTGTNATPVNKSVHLLTMVFFKKKYLFYMDHLNKTTFIGTFEGAKTFIRLFLRVMVRMGKGAILNNR